MTSTDEIFTNSNKKQYNFVKHLLPDRVQVYI